MVDYPGPTSTSKPDNASQTAEPPSGPGIPVEIIPPPPLPPLPLPTQPSLHSTPGGDLETRLFPEASDVSVEVAVAETPPTEPDTSANLVTDDSLLAEPPGSTSIDFAASLDAFYATHRALTERLDALLAAFDTKLAIDDHKNQQIDTLHRELQQHKQDLLYKSLRPLLVGLARLHDNLGRVAESVRERPEVLTPGAAALLIEEFQEDVEILLDENGVALFTEPVDRFEPRRQTVRQMLETTDLEQAGRIARRVRPGFERDGLLLQKERVDVYVAAASVVEPTPLPRAPEA